MKIIRKVLLVFLGLFLAVLALEVIVRVLNIPPNPLAPLPIPDYRLSSDPIIGYEYQPGYQAAAEPFDGSHKGFRINRAGFRDHEYEEKKPEGVYRILVLGDSTTAGNFVAQEKTYTKVLENLLNQDQAAGKRYEVLNMGVGGYQTLQEVETLKVKGLKYKPDLVLLTVCLNDFSLQGDGGVYRRLQRANHLSVPQTKQSFLGRFLRFSRLAFAVYHRLNLAKTDYERWYLANVLQGRTPVEAGFTLFSELQQKNGFSVRILILPAFEGFFDKYQSGDLHKKIFRAAEGLPGLTVVDLLADFARRDNDARKLSVDGCHMNETGHRIMAEILLPMVKTVAGDTSRR